MSGNHIDTDAVAPVAPGASNTKDFKVGLLSDARALFATVEADRGIVARPMLTPHLEPRPIGEDAVLLVSETYNASLYGAFYQQLLPLLDGSRTHDEIVEAMADRAPALKVKTALVGLSTKGYVCSADIRMSREQAAFWSSLGASPAYAEAALDACSIAVEQGDIAAGLTEALVELGANVLDVGNAAGSDLLIVATNDYLDPAHGRTNAARLSDGAAWMLVRPGGMAAMIGPVFRPGDDRPCWECLAHRYRGNREIDNFLRNVGADATGVVGRADNPAMRRAVAAMAAAEVAKWVVFGDVVSIGTQVVSFDPIRLATDRHPVQTRPQCPACGDEAMHSPTRPPVPVTLTSQPKPYRNSGGVRTVTPEETVRRYEHLVSPISGVVTQLMRTSSDNDDWLHVYWAGSNLALKSDNLRLLRTSLRTKSSGKGSTPAQARASALCEAVERYSGVFQGDEIRLQARLSDFAPGDAVHPNDIQLFSEDQYEQNDLINARGSRFNYVPTRFDRDAAMDWTPVWSLTAGRFRHLPTSMLYYSVPTEGGPVYCGPDSNGCAAGNSLEEAILQGFLELVERDAFACWWYNRVQRPSVDLSSFDDPYLKGSVDYYRRFNRDLWVLDITHDLGVPTFVAVSRRTDKPTEDIVYSAGSHFDPQIAALRAVCELNQYLPAVRDVQDGGDGYLYDDPESLWWWRNATLENQPYLAPHPDMPARRADDFEVYATEDLLDDVERCRALVEARGMEMLVLDQTRPDVGLPVAKVIVPGMRHFWARTGEGRLYDVPVDLGWLEKPTAEADLNPIAVFI